MKLGENQSVPRSTKGRVGRAVLLSAVAALALGQVARVIAAEPDKELARQLSNEKDTDVTSTIGGSVRTKFLALGVGKSVIVDLPRDVKDVLVADPKIANAVVRSSQRAYIIGAAVGQTNVVFFDADGQQVAAYDIAIKRDLNGVRSAIRQTYPGSRSRASATASS